MARKIVRRAQSPLTPWQQNMLPLLQRIHQARGATDVASAQPRLAQLLPPERLLGMDDAVALLMQAIDTQKHIVVVADFDCDGATACALAVRGLRLLGATQVSYAVPNRQVHGYGLSPALVEELTALSPDVLLTVDHGIACHAGVATARAKGWEVVVTDHHLAGDSLPEANAIVNPNQPGDTFPSKALAGVGVMFYVLLALRRALRDAGAFDADNAPDLSQLLDVVALGTVADLVPLDINNRALVAAGLRRIRAGHANAGIAALIAVAGKSVQTLSTMDIGFALAPRINAAGRLEDMTIGIECLLCDEPVQAMQLAQMLDGINAERREIQQVMVEDAEAALAQALADSDAHDEADKAGQTARVSYCFLHPQWHQGVVGLVASKMKDRLHRPVIAFAPADAQGQQLRGSARSITGFHIRDALAAVDSAYPGLITRFGGHAMAAGLSLPQAAFAQFSEAFEAVAQRMIAPESLHDVLLSDGGLLEEEFNRYHAEQLRDGGVWGQGYPEPLFDDVFTVQNWRVVGQRHLRLDLVLGRRRLSAIQFNGWDGQQPALRLHLAYRLVPDDWRGGDAVQLIVVHRQNAQA